MATQTLSREGTEQHLLECGLGWPSIRGLLKLADANGNQWVPFSAARAVRKAYASPGYVVRTPYGSDVR